MKKQVLITAIFLLVGLGPVRAESWSLPGMTPDERPRVLYGPGEEDSIRSRLIREPYASIYLRVVQFADRSYDLADHETSPEQIKANIAQAAAFVYAMNRSASKPGEQVVIEPFESPADRKAYGDRAVELLNNMVASCRIVDYESTQQDIHCAQELTLYSTAYDILAGSDYPFENSQAIEDRLATYAADFFYKWTDAYWISINRSANQNHGSKTAAAIGLAAIVLNGYDRTFSDELDDFRDPRAWIDFGLRLSDILFLDALISVDGAYCEGPVYYGYAAINLLVFFWAWHRYTRGADWEVDGDIFYDPWTNPRLARTQDWLLSILMPDGTFPPFDDCTPGGSHYWGVFSLLPNGATYRWAWEYGVKPYHTSGSVDQSILTLVAFDDSILPVAPSIGPSLFSPQAGHAIFRSGWEADSTYLIMMAESGIAAGYAFRFDGEPLEGSAGHEHSDPGATHMMAHAEVLLLDSGYLGWQNHDKVRWPQNHNLLLVDGKGPQITQLSIPPFTIVDGGIVIEDMSREGGYVPGEDCQASLSQGFATDFFEHARMQTQYFLKVPTTDWTRRMSFVDKQYFIQADTVTVEDGQVHQLEILHHLNGGGTSGGQFEQTEQGALVVRPGASLIVQVALAGGDLSFSVTEDIHDAWHWREETHSVLHAETEGSQVAFITVYYPQATAETAPTIDVVSESGNLAALKITRSGRVELAAVATPGAGRLTADVLSFEGSFALAGSNGVDPADVLTIADGISVSSGGRSIQLEQPGTITARWEPDRLSGYYAGPPNRVTLSDVSGYSSGSGFCAFEQKDGGLVLDIVASGPYEVYFAGPQANHVPVASMDMPATGETNLEYIVDASSSCDLEGDPLSYSWTVKDKPVRSQVEFEDPTAKTTSLIPDWPGHYRIALTVSDGQATSRETSALIWVELGEPLVDGGLDGGADAGQQNPDSGGCACQTKRPDLGFGLGWLVLITFMAVGRLRTTRR
jgi:hypothetical protein